MRIALISPYSWTYPGGVTRHIEALAQQFIAEGHDVRVLSPVDPDDALAVRMHRGQRPQQRELPAWLTPLGRTVGLPFNGAVSTLALHPLVGRRLRAELEHFRPDVIHVHEPMVPFAGWAATKATGAPVVGTFHAYATSPITNNLGNATGAWRRFNRLQVRIAVSEAAAWTGERFFGGSYRVIPNGVELDPLAGPKEIGDPRRPMKIAFVGQAVERKGLGILLPAFEAVRDQVGAELRIVGAAASDLEHILVDPTGVVALGKVDDEHKRRELRDADLLCAPSLGGESFGMVLTEAFAAGTPVVASEIAGYRDVVTDGKDGVLVPRGDATALAATLRELALHPGRRAAMAAQAAKSAERYAWPRVAAELLDTYDDARHPARARSSLRRSAIRHGFATADGAPTILPRRIPKPEPAPPPGTRSPVWALMRKGVFAALAVAVLLFSLKALKQIGVDELATSLVQSQKTWIVVALLVMCLSMVFRAGAWHAALRAAMPDAKLGRTLAIRATSIGVLMSATLPARLGEPARALVVSRRIGRSRETLPVVAGTIVSQTVLNLVALTILGSVMFSTINMFRLSTAILVGVLVPLAVVVSIVVLPTLAGRASGQSRMGALTRPIALALARTRAGLQVFRSPRLGAAATFLQLGAWVLQWLSCYLLLVALGIRDEGGMVAAAAVLFAVNVTAILPVTPSNLGTFQFACVAVLGAYGVGRVDALAYGVVLQAIEILTAVLMGVPALLREGVSWRGMRLRAIHAAPVHLPPLHDTARAGATAGS